LKTIGHSLKNLGPFQKTLRPTLCSKLVTAWAKPFDGLAFLTYNCDVTADPEMLIDELFKKKRRLNFVF